MDNELLHNIRKYELAELLALIPNRGHVLEIGAGAGWQAKELADKGFSIEAIDLEQSGYKEYRVWPVQNYDGKRIPFENCRFDMVFSSNVLEHIEHVEEFQAEIRRVLKPSGLAVHVLPSASWRFWTCICFYPIRAKQVIRLLHKKGKAEKAIQEERQTISGTNERDTIIKKITKAIFPGRHGVIGNSISELYLFSRLRWKNLFMRTGWNVLQCRVNRLFYTGYLCSGFNISARRILSYLLGSSCAIYILTKKDQAN